MRRGAYGTYVRGRRPVIYYFESRAARDAAVRSAGVGVITSTDARLLGNVQRAAPAECAEGDGHPEGAVLMWEL